MICTNCGKECNPNASFCDTCGSPIVNGIQQVDSKGAKSQENMIVYMLSYLGILFFLPLVVYPESTTGRFHANQGLVLLIASVLGQIVLAIMNGILLAISWRFWFITSLLYAALGIATLWLVIVGMKNAKAGEEKPLPYIGNITIIK